MASGCDGRGKDTLSGLACQGRDEIRLVLVVESREIVACNRMGTIFNSQLPRDLQLPARPHLLKIP